MRVAFVTGGTSGIGAAAAQALLAAGYRVAVNHGSNIETAQRFAARITGVTLSINGGKYMA